MVVGARPNFVKIAPIMKESKKYSKMDIILVHTGQHYDREMSKAFFEDLDIPKPDICLGIGSGSHAVQTGAIMAAFEKICIDKRPDIVVVVGDVNSTLGCSIVSAKLHIPVAHVEAGLRSGDRSMPEEINRIVTDAVSSIFFTTCREANDNLKKEGVASDKIYFVGNVMIDTLIKARDAISGNEKPLVKNDEYALLTLHRPCNVDDETSFKKIVKGISEISKKIPVLFPAHPRTQKKIREYRMGRSFISQVPGKNRPICLANAVNLTGPLSYVDFLHVMKRAKLVFTDSGGIQEETTVLGIPCLTLRDSTERWITVHEGTNEIVGTNVSAIVKNTNRILNGAWKKGNIPRYWDGKAAERIVRVLNDFRAESKERK